MRAMLIGIALAGSFAMLSPAEATAAATCASDSDAAACLCSGDTVDDAVFFPTLREQAIGVRRKLCIDAAPEAEIYQALFDLVNSNNGVWFDEHGGFEGGSDPLEAILEAMASSSVDGRFEIPNAGLSLNDEILVGDAVFRPATPDRCQDAECGPLFDEFLEYYNYAHTTLAAKGALAFARSVDGLSDQWSRFLDHSRSQTPLELLINSAVFARGDRGEFSAPPDKQWIVLHPALVIENVSDAIDGEETIEALMIELGGVNWWRQMAWYRPSGASIIASYSDRPGVDDIGYGVAFHFRSLYTIGYTDHDGADGILISFDLLKLLENKRAVVEQMLP